MAQNSRKNRAVEKTVKPELVDLAVAKAVADGDLVNFRLLFSPFSPAREASPEAFETDKYAYLLPDEAAAQTPRFEEALAAVGNEPTRRHISEELSVKRPPRLPSELLLLLADNAVRGGKYTSAAQAYELLRIRARMQDEFFAQGDAALEVRDIEKAVSAYVTGAGLNYDYAAFPEPLPAVPDYQTAALIMHGDYPNNPMDCVAMQETRQHTATAISYLLGDMSVAGRIEKESVETQVRFVVELNRRIDPGWTAFAARYRQAREMAASILDNIQEKYEHHGEHVQQSLEQEIEVSEQKQDPEDIPACMLGRRATDGEWWQYLKELAYAHPASALFICRLAVGESEILVPRYNEDSPLAEALELNGTNRTGRNSST